MTTELKNRVERIMSHCLQQADIYNNYQLGTKVVINGIYGAFGFSGFYFYNKNIAESVTKQGKHAILNAESLINKLAQKVWLKDKKTHNMMGIKWIIHPNGGVRKKELSQMRQLRESYVIRDYSATVTAVMWGLTP